MKFFTNLPKTTFSSTIGSFTISDFFTYLDIESAFIEEGTVTIDNKTTLVEAAATVYQDPNSFWAFVAANNTVNPFDLLADNATDFAEIEQNKISFLLFPNATDVTGGSAFTEGSLIFPYASNTGACYLYGYTGNYDISGAYAIIENSSYYDGYMTIGTQYNTATPFISVATGPEQLVVVQKNSDGTYTWQGVFYAKNKKQSGNKIEFITNPEDAKVIYKEAVSSNITIDELLAESTPIAGATVATTAQQNIDTISKTIQAYVPSKLGFIQSSFVTTKYN